MNAPVYIEIGIMSKERMNWERFRPSRTSSHTFYYTTDLDHYLEITGQIGLEAWDYVQSEYSHGILEMEIHVAVTIENVTAPSSGKGVVPRHKARRDSQMNDVEFSSIQVLQQHIEKVVAELREIANY